MPKINIRNFSLEHSLDSGQFFRCWKIGEWHYIATHGIVFKARQEGSKLFYEGANTSFVRNFFALDEDFDSVREKLAKDKAVAEAMKQYNGLRILRQHPWECTLAFICSSFSNIKRIKGCLYSISKNFGRKINFEGKHFYSMPLPGRLKDSGLLAKCGLGYRQKYLYDAAKTIRLKQFEALKQMQYAEAKKQLMDVPGVGEKVADCILLFSLGHGEAFPVDVWIKRAMEELYFRGRKTPEKKIREFAQRKWGKHAGYAQQYLYHWRRMRD